MRGKTVDRRFGWDCHGLPAELHSEAELKLSGRREILKYGMARFNEHCRTSVMQFGKDWEYYVNRSARWVDFDNDYRTMDLTYMESTMWAFKQLWDKGLVYEGFRVVPYSWAAQTPLSQSETRLDDSYRMRQDPGADRRLPARRRAEYPPAGVDDDAMDAALQHGSRGQAGRRLRRPGKSRRARRHRRSLARALRGGARGLCRSRPPQGGRTPRAHLPAAVPVLRRQEEGRRLPRRAGRFHRGWARAPASSTWRRPSARTTLPYR